MAEVGRSFRAVRSRASASWRYSSGTSYMATLNDMSTWAVHTRAGLREFFTKEGKHWVEQNRAKNSRWAKLAREGHDIAWEFENRVRGGYTGRVLIDGEILTAKDAYKRFFR